MTHIIDFISKVNSAVNVEVFFTTIIICTLSALIILTTGIWNTGDVNGAALSIASFNAIIPDVGGIIVTLSTIFFALSTILGWAYYGEVCVQYLFKKKMLFWFTESSMWQL